MNTKVKVATSINNSLGKDAKISCPCKKDLVADRALDWTPSQHAFPFPFGTLSTLDGLTI